MTPDDMKALIDRVRDPMVCTDDLHRELADALEAALSPLPDGELDEIERRLTEFEAEGYCRCYHESQERDCHQHGDEHARFHGDVADDQRALLAEVRRLRALSSRPDEETEWGAGYEADPGDGNGPRWYGMDATGFVIREAAEREVERYCDSQIRLVRRRKAGPWEPAPTDGNDN